MGAESSTVQGEILALLREAVRPTRVARVYDSECMYQCFPHKPGMVRKPDVSVVLTARLPNGRCRAECSAPGRTWPSKSRRPGTGTKT